MAAIAVQAVAGGVRQPRVSGDCRVVASGAMGEGGDGARDLQGRGRGVRVRPHRRRPGGVVDRQYERQPAVGAFDRPQPVAQLGGVGRRRRCDLLEHLEGVQCPRRVAAGRPEVGLQGPAVTAVGVAVRVQRPQHPVGVTGAHHQVGSVAVEQAALAHQERPR